MNPGASVLSRGAPVALRYSHDVIALSTAWNAKRHDSARSLFDELISLGFRRFEVNVHFSEEMVRETERMVRGGEIEVISVHNYCPVPQGIERTRGGGDLFHFSSPDASVRKAGIENTIRTLETAARLGAKLMVGHWGTTEIPGAKEAQKKAIERVRAGQPAGLDDLLRERERQVGEHLKRALDSFSQIISAARSLGIKIGVENRFYFHEIPGLDEIGAFLDLAPDVAGYWHDMGHAAVLEYLGIYPPHAYRDRWASRGIALHVHDTLRGQDHLAMGAGEVDFRAELSAFPKDAPWIIETHYAEAAELTRMGERLAALESPT